MNIAKRAMLVFLIMVLCVACDQTTKSLAVSALPETKTFSYLGGTLRFQVAYNRGAFLSLGSSLPDVWRQRIFTFGTGFFLIGLVAFALFFKPGRLPVISAISLIAAGGAGNLIDRVTHGGSVVDFISIGAGPLGTGIFNIADVAVIAGTLLLLRTASRRLEMGG